MARALKTFWLPSLPTGAWLVLDSVAWLEHWLDGLGLGSGVSVLSCFWSGLLFVNSWPALEPSFGFWLRRDSGASFSFSSTYLLRRDRVTENTGRFRCQLARQAARGWVFLVQY